MYIHFLVNQRKFFKINDTVMENFGSSEKKCFEIFWLKGFQLGGGLEEIYLEEQARYTGTVLDIA